MRPSRRPLEEPEFGFDDGPARRAPVRAVRRPSSEVKDEELLSAIQTLIDKDGDGMLSMHEAKSFLSAVQKNEATEQDVNRDDKLVACLGQPAEKFIQVL